MKELDLIYLFVAAVHPITELVDRTSLRKFLNLAYYRTNRDDFPVSKLAGILGSLFVLAILVAPPFDWWIGLWHLAFGLAVADLIQHAVHFGARPQEAAPRVHLVTILGVVILLWLSAEGRVDLLDPQYLWVTILGAAIIFGNWARNSRKVRTGKGAPEGRVAHT